MVKQSWNINLEERLRILNLHENATKNHYLVTEQEGEVTYQMCSVLFYKKGDNFYIKNPENGQFEALTKLSEMKVILRPGSDKKTFKVAFDMDSPVGSAIDLGEIFNANCRAQYEKPNPRVIPYTDIVVYDDIKYKLPIWGAFTTTSANLPINADRLETIKEKDGTVIELGKTRTNNFALGIIPLMIAKSKEKPDSVQKQTTQTTDEFELNLESPFNFDQTNLTPESEKVFLDFVERLKKNINKYSGDVIVTTSASIDGVGKENYDMNLSKRRAESIIGRLKSILGDTKLNFVANAIGQTDKFAPGKKFPESNSQETAPNRRLIITLPLSK